MTTVRTVESFHVGSIKDHELPSNIHGLPFPPEELTRLLESCPAVVALPNDEVHEYLPLEYATDAQSDYQPSPYELRQPSPIHVRSFQLIGPEFEQPWQDEYGNTYSALTFKGNNYSKPGIIKSFTASEGYIPYGLQESTVIGRVLAASQALRSRGISTEYILGLAEPKLLPWPLVGTTEGACEYVDLAEYKRRITGNYWQELDEEQRNELSYVELFSKFQDMVFYTSLRATDTPYRLTDLNDLTIRQKVYDIVNANSAGQPFDADNAKDDGRFLVDIVAPTLGRNFARLHIDLAHRFPHLGNITAFGGIVDLDSVHGAGLGLDDAPITMKDRVYDLYYLLQELPLKHPSLPIQIGDQLSAHYKFISTYLHETFKEFDGDQAAIEHIGQLLVNFENHLKTRDKQDDTRGRSILYRMKRTYYKEMLGLDMEDLSTDGQLYQTMLGYIKTNWEDLKTASTQYLFKELPPICDDAINDNINELNTAYHADTPYELLDQPDIRKRLTRVWAAHAVDVLIGKLAEQFATAETGVAKIHAIQDLATRTMTYNDLLQLFGEELCEIGEPIVTAMFDEQERIVRESLTYTYPDRLFGDESTHSIHTGFADKQFWYSGSEVPWHEVEKLIQSGQIPVTFEQTTYAQSNAPIIKSSSPDATLTEVITDGMFDGFFMEHDEQGRPFIAPSSDQPLSYIAIVEKSHQTNAVSLRILHNSPDSAPEQLWLF